jgi:hypothetical protein
MNFNNLANEITVKSLSTGWSIMFLLLVSVRDFLLHHNIQTESQAYLMEPESSFLVGKVVGA